MAMLWSLGYKIAHAILYPGPVCTCREYCVVGGIFWLPTHSGAGMNMKVGHPSCAKRRKNFFWSRPSTFLAQQVQ